MLFSSAIFIVFFFVVYLLYWHLPLKGKHILLILSGAAFYAWYSPYFLLMFLVLIFINYFFVTALFENRKKSLLAAAIVFDAGILLFFKYFYFFAESAGFITGNLYLQNAEKNLLQDFHFQVVTPIAISFYTFQMIAVLADTYQGKIKEKYTFKEFYLFVLFFPVFLSGPILRASDIRHQYHNPSMDMDRMTGGILLLIQGIVKKVLMADRLAATLIPVWMNPGAYDAVYLIMGMPAYAAMVYLDFSGYTDMARGIARLLGFELPENFTGPFFARSMSELWQRWHITLSSWLRDYIYIPLGGSKQGELITYRNLLITMAVGGFWHGATWTMVLWGVSLGMVLIIERIFRVHNIVLIPWERLRSVAGVFYTFITFSLTATLFGVASLKDTYAAWKGILTLQRGLPASAPETIIGMTVLVFLFNAWQYHPFFDRVKNQNVRLAFSAVLVFVTGILVNIFGDVSGSFVYFKF